MICSLTRAAPLIVLLLALNVGMRASLFEQLLHPFEAVLSARISQRDIKQRRLVQDALLVREGIEAVSSVVSTHTAFSNSAKR